jgi:hypothetical protein
VVDLGKLDFHPVTSDRWNDIEGLFGEQGACGGCWCMWWKLIHSEFTKCKGSQNRLALKQSVKSGKTPGILAYLNEEPVGWVAVEPRNAYPRLERSRILKPVDDKLVWSIVCFFIARKYRHQGICLKLIEAAVDHVRRQGGRIVEAYPVESKSGRAPDVFAYTGRVASFQKAHFLEVARRSETRPMMRFEIQRDQ